MHKRDERVPLLPQPAQHLCLSIASIAKSEPSVLIYMVHVHRATRAQRYKALTHHAHRQRERLDVCTHIARTFQTCMQLACFAHELHKWIEVRRRSKPRLQRLNALHVGFAVEEKEV